MANIVEIIAKFVNEASPGLKQVGADVDNVGKKGETTTTSTDKMRSSLIDLAGKLGLTVSAAGLAAGAIAFLRSTVEAYGESEVVAAQVNAVLQSTGQIAGVTSEEIDSLADSLSRMSGVDDEAIKRGEALLLTFTKVGKDVFPQATEAALNMSMAMGTDLQSAIMQVGKALNEPIQGAAALRRVGVQLTDQQEEQIKQFMAVNDIASAQAIILGELKTEFGGVAEAMGNTTVGSTNKLKVAWGNLMETMGEDSAGVWRGITDGLTDVVNNLNDTAEATNRFQSLEARGTEITRLYGGELAVTNRQINEYGQGIMEAGYEYARAEQYGLAWSQMLANQTETTYSANDALSTYVPNFSSLLDLTSEIADETEKYNEKQTDLQTKQAEIRAQIDDLLANGWSPYSQKILDLQADYDALGMKSQELADKHREAMMRMQYDLLITKLSADGLTNAEYQIAQQAGLTFGVFDQESVDAARNMDLVAEAVKRGELRVEDMKKALDLLPQLKNIDVVINAIANIAAGNPEPDANNPSAKRRHGGAVGFAEGGSFIVPGGFPNDTYLIGLTSGEHVTVVPPGDLKQTGTMAGFSGNPIQVVVNISSPINLMTEQEAQNVLLPLVIDAVRQAQAEARL